MNNLEIIGNCLYFRGVKVAEIYDNLPESLKGDLKDFIEYVELHF